MGGLSRKYSAIKELQSEGVDPLILDAGDLLFSAKTIKKSDHDSELFRASKILSGYEKIGCDAINVGQYEFASGYENLRQLTDGTSMTFISANLVDSETHEPIFNPYTIIERNRISFGVIGLTDLIPDTIGGVLVEDYKITGKRYIQTIKNKTDFIILLVNSGRETYEDLPKLFGDADIILTSGSTFLTRPVMNQAENGPYVFSGGREGRYLNRIDLSVINKNQPIINRSYYESKINYIQKRLDRYQEKNSKVPLLKLYSDQPTILEIIDSGRRDIARMKKILNKKSNQITFQNVAMDAKIRDYPDILKYINNALDDYSKLSQSE